MKALRQALKDVPSSVDKNERFRRVSALVGGRHTKKECYDKYKVCLRQALLLAAAVATHSLVEKQISFTNMSFITPIMAPGV